MSRGFKDLRVYQLAFQLAMAIFHESKCFPSEERYSLTDQIRRSARRIAANVAEAYRKRLYPKSCVSKLADADGECAGTQCWIEFARESGYWPADIATRLTTGYEEVGRKVGGMITHPEKFAT